MEKSNGTQKSKLTVEELRKYPGNENLTDQELEQQSNTLLELSLILYDIYQKEQSEKEKENPEDN